MREGIVIRPVEPVHSYTLSGPLSMKVINNFCRNIKNEKNNCLQYVNFKPGFPVTGSSYKLVSINLKKSEMVEMDKTQAY